MYRHLNTIGDHPYIPQQAFLFIPQRINKNERNDFHIGSAKGIRRLLFQGWAQETYTPYQLQQLKKFDQYITRKGKKLDQRWDRSWTLRWLLSTNCNIKKTLQQMQKFMSYQKSIQKIQFVDPAKKYLNEGIFYIAGRDSHYRPILVFDVDKIIKLQVKQEQLLIAQTYFFEFVLRNLLIPGQVQNWIAIIDSAHHGLFSLIGSMKKSFTFLSDTYRSRMFVCYVVRIPSSLSFLWGMVKNFLDQQTVRKINFYDQMKVQALLQFCNPSQLQQKFGGTLPNIQPGHFWPPREVSENYKIQKQQTKIITSNLYTEYYKNKVLFNTKFLQDLIIKQKTSADIRQNKQLHRLKHLERQFSKILKTTFQDQISYKPFVKNNYKIQFMNQKQKYI